MYLHKLPYGLALRNKRICSHPDDFEKRKCNIDQRFRQRGYNRRDVRYQLQETDKKTRQELLETDNSKKSKKSSRKVPLILSYSNSLPNIKAILKKNERIFNDNTKIKNKITNRTFLVFK